jgi:hypothetical protein
MRIRLLLLAALLAVASSAGAQSLQDKLFERVVTGADCKQTINNGLICEYNIGKILSFSIKDAGGSDTVIGFNTSNINAELYAVYYMGCVVVVPGAAHPRNYDRDYGVYISPMNGRVYRTKQECQSARK